MEAIAERQSKEQPSALPESWIDRLFQRFAAMYGTDKFTSMFRTQDMGEVKRTWAAELGRYSRDELALAVESIRAKHPSWPPTMLELSALCRPVPEALNPESAFYEAVRGIEQRKRGEMGNWSHRAVYHAAMDVSTFDLLNLTWPQIRARWTTALNARLADPNLPPIPEPPKQLAAPEVPIDRNVERLHEMLASLTGKKKDDRAWVGKILERKARNDPTLSDIAYKMALDSVNVR